MTRQVSCLAIVNSITNLCSITENTVIAQVVVWGVYTCIVFFIATVYRTGYGVSTIRIWAILAAKAAVTDLSSVAPGTIVS